MALSQDQSPQLFPKWYFLVNTLFIMLGLALLLAYWGIGEFIRGLPPYDYLHLMSSSQQFCFSQSTFEFGWPHLYPASFYTTFCLLYRTIPPVLSFVWLMIPFFAVLLLAGRRSAVLVYPPFVILLILGQSTWLLFPIYGLVAYRVNHPPKWWYGIFLFGAVFKPHIALMGVAWLVYRWYRYRNFWLTAVATWVILLLPGFLMRPTWLFEWLPSGRGFEPISLGSIAIVPVRLLGIDVNRVIGMDPGAGNQAMIWLFCGLFALFLLFSLYKRRGRLEFYDWLLVFCFANPLLNDYDLIIILPLIALFPRRLLLALTSGILVWVYVMITAHAMGTGGQYNAVLLITTVLLFDRFYRLRGKDRIGAIVRW